MHAFVRNLITEWRRLELPFEGETLVVAVSGGADSVSLLLGVHELVKGGKLNNRIIAAHFNHGFRDGESDADEAFVRDLTVKLGIELAAERGRVSREGNLEQNARNARYDFLQKTAANVNAFGVLTGHTVNDQAETFLMNLIRGSGPDGLAGMQSIRSYEFQVPRSGLSNAEPETWRSELLLVRPLLTWAKRGDTEAFCRDLRIDYRYDTMNEDTAFKRVRIRKILLPLLQDFNPNIVETLANTAGLMQNLQESVAPRNCLIIADELGLSEIKSLPKSDIGETIRAWLKHHRGTTRQLQLKHIRAIERLVFSEKSGRTVEVPGGKVVKSGGKLIYKKNRVEN